MAEYKRRDVALTEHEWHTTLRRVLFERLAQHVASQCVAVFGLDVQSTERQAENETCL